METVETTGIDTGSSLSCGSSLNDKGSTAICFSISGGDGGLCNWQKSAAFSLHGSSSSGKVSEPCETGSSSQECMINPKVADREKNVRILSLYTWRKVGVDLVGMVEGTVRC